MKNLLLKYNAQVPRYTSYPTAPHFEEEFDSEIYKKWLAELDANKPISLYLHIPYCRKLCWYCGCNTKITLQDQPILEFVDVLLKEIEMVANFINKRLKISQIHFGGGSPNILTAKDFQKIFDQIRKYFDILDKAEIATEVDPRHLIEEQVKTLAKNGVNRISMGVQDFDPETQKAINRVQPFEMVKDSVELIRKYNIKQINFDFIYGLPLQTVANMKKNIELALKLRPERISIFGYAHVPWMKKHMRLIHEEELPNPEERLDIAEIAEQELIKAKYIPIGIDHFAIPDDEMSKALEKNNLKRNFQGYVTDNAETLIGFGTSAIGFIENKGYIQNNPMTGKYSKAVLAGKLPTHKGIAVDKEDLMHKEIIMDLMCFFEIDLNNYLKKYQKPKNHFNKILKTLKPYQTDGLIEIKENKITINQKAKQIVRIIASHFDQYFTKSKKRHSVAV